MGLQLRQNKVFASRCCYAAYFAFGFVIALLTLITMLWILWCYVGLVTFQVSESQRRAIVNYSATTAKPSPSPVISSPIRNASSGKHEELGAEITANNISKSPSTNVHRGSSRDQPSSSLLPPRSRDDGNHKAEIVTGTRQPSVAEPDSEDRIYARRVLASGTENRPEVPEESGRRSLESPGTNPEINPTRVDERDTSRGRGAVDDSRPLSRDDRQSAPRRDDTSQSRRSDSEYERDLPRRPIDADRTYTDSDRSRPRYDDRDTRRRYDDDDRDSRRRYDDDDRDRYSKDTRRDEPRAVERDRVVDRDVPDRDDRYRDDERYSASDDRYRDRDDRRKGDERDYDDRPRRRPPIDDRYREDRYRGRDTDDDRVRSADDGYRSSDDRPRLRDDDRPRLRDDDKYRSRDDDRYRSRDDDRYRARDDDRYSPRPDDRSDERPRDRKFEDDPKPRVRPRPIDDDDAYRNSRVRDRDEREPLRSDADRKSASINSDDDIRAARRPSDYDSDRRDNVRPYPREESAIRTESLPRATRTEDRDEYRRPSTRYDDRDDRIYPSRTREEIRTTEVETRSRDSSRYDEDTSRYDNRRDRVDDDRYRNVRPDDSRRSSSAIDKDRRVVEERPRATEVRTRDDERDEEKFIDRRSYSSQEDDAYRRSNTRTVSRSDYDDRYRKPADEEDRYTRRDDSEEVRSRPRGDYGEDRTRYRDDDKTSRRTDDRYPVDDRARSDYVPPRTYDRYPSDDDRPPRREPSSRRDTPALDDVDRPYPRDVLSPPRSSDRRYVDDRDDIDTGRAPIRSPARGREPVLASSMSPMSTREPGHVVIREKRFQSSHVRTQEATMALHQDRRKSNEQTESYHQPRETPLTAKEVIEAAIRHPETSNSDNKEAVYPVFHPRVTNMTSPEVIRPNERRGTTITAKKKRR